MPAKQMAPRCGEEQHEADCRHQHGCDQRQPLRRRGARQAAQPDDLAIVAPAAPTGDRDDRRETNHKGIAPEALCQQCRRHCPDQSPQSRSEQAHHAQPPPGLARDHGVARGRDRGDIDHQERRVRFAAAIDDGRDIGAEHADQRHHLPVGECNGDGQRADSDRRNEANAGRNEVVDARRQKRGRIGCRNRGGPERRSNGGGIARRHAPPHKLRAGKERERCCCRCQHPHLGREEPGFDGVADEEIAGDAQRNCAKPDRQAQADEPLPVEARRRRGGGRR